jgi:uncharacterized protein YcfJ
MSAGAFANADSGSFPACSAQRQWCVRATRTLASNDGCEAFERALDNAKAIARARTSHVSGMRPVQFPFIAPRQDTPHTNTRRGLLMKQLAISAIAFATLAATGAAQAQSFFDSARVRASEPQYESVTVPRQVCSQQTVTEVQRVGGGQDYTGAVVGGLVGGLLGNQVGRGHGREAATGVGAIAGAIAGNQIANNNRAPEQVVETPRQVTTCQNVNEVQNRISGYRVTYDYRGQTYTTVMRDNPGPNLQVRVTVEPVAPR